jgi:hypothetical protein
MFEESPLVAPVQLDRAEMVESPGVEKPLPVEASPAPSAEQRQAVDAIFAAQEEESRQAAGLIGMWAGTLMLHNVLVDTLTTEEDKEEEKQRKKTKDRDKDGPKAE